MDEQVMEASRLAREEMAAWREDDYELMAALQKRRSELRLDHEEWEDGSLQQNACG